MSKTDALTQVEQQLLLPADLTSQHVEAVLGKMLSPQIDLAELYFQQRLSETWTLEDGIVKEGNYHTERGVGARAISGEKTGFAFSDDIVLPALEQAATAAKSISLHQGEGKIKTASAAAVPLLYSATNPLNALATADKIALLQRINTEARQLDPNVVEVNASLMGSHEFVYVHDSDGHLAADIRPLVRLNVTVIVEKNGRREVGYAGGGGRTDYQQFIEADKALDYVHEAIRVANVNLAAKAAPAGVMPVVMGPGWSGVLLHEAVGHGLEGDFNRKGISAFSGRMGEKVAGDNVTVVDDGTLVGRRGSLSVDDEGIATECTVLIENGILRGYMQDKLNAKLMGVKPTGNGRRESYAHTTMPRMTNTYMLAGEYEADEIIASVDKGLYITGLGGGSVDITSGKFVFSTSEAYYIENGKKQYPVKGASLIGSGPEVMQRVSMVGNDLSLDSGVGICGKDGQSVAVGVGQPTLKVDSLTVGGTER